MLIDEKAGTPLQKEEQERLEILKSEVVHAFSIFIKGKVTKPDGLSMKVLKLVSGDSTNILLNYKKLSTQFITVH